MKSWVCTELTGEDGLVLQEGESPRCLSGTVRIRSHYAALNFPDTLLTRGLYQMKLAPPFVPGSECAGVITTVGEGIDNFAIGDRVLALAGFGTFAEEVVVTPPMQQLHRIPDAMPFDVAAGFCMIYGTAAHSLRQRGALRPGETLLVLGSAGGCGSAAVEVGKAMGARVIAGASSDEKCAVAQQLGADATINYSRENLRDRLMALTDDRGADVIFDPIGDKLFDQARRCIAWNGRYLVIGFAGGAIPKFGINYSILKSMSLVGVAFGQSAIMDPAMNAANFEQLFAWYREGRLHPHIGNRYAFADLPQACREMYAGKAVGKTVIQMSG